MQHTCFHMMAAAFAAVLVSASAPALADFNYLAPFTPSLNITDRHTDTLLGKAGYNIPPGPNFWSLRQWGNTHNLIPAVFPAGQPWEMAHGNSRLKFYPKLDGLENVYELAASSVPCATGEEVTEVNELDMFLEPYKMNLPRIPLADIGQLKFQVGLAVTYAETRNTCSVNLSTYVASVILSNSADPPQWMFLQFRLGGTIPESKALSWCPDYERTTNPSYANVFCVDDSIRNAGGKYLGGLGSRTTTVDILPRLTEIIDSDHVKAGPVPTELDDDPSAWSVAGVYFGIVNYGGTVVTTQWSQPELKASGGTFCSGRSRTHYVCETPVNPSAGWRKMGDGCFHRPSSTDC